jgi:hypothetical protein
MGPGSDQRRGWLLGAFGLRAQSRRGTGAKNSFSMEIIDLLEGRKLQLLSHKNSPHSVGGGLTFLGFWESPKSRCQ